jgi:hypothetical protein
VCPWFGIRILGELMGCFLDGSQRHDVPLRQKTQVRIAAQRSFYNMNP